MQYLDEALPRRIDGWFSPILGTHMPIVSYGHHGKPLLLFPTAAADFLENERFFLVNSVQPALFAGRTRIFCIESINKLAWMDDSLPVAEKGRRHNLYSRYIEEEVVPYIRATCGDGSVRIATSGASFGAFHAANALFRRPDLFDTVIAMAGFYDLGPDYLQGYCDDDCYFNNPSWYLPGLEGPSLDLLRTGCSINIITGQGNYEKPESSYRFSALLHSKGIPHNLDVWGYDVDHDWPWWRKMLPYYVDRLGW